MHAPLNHVERAEASTEEHGPCPEFYHMADLATSQRQTLLRVFLEPQLRYGGLRGIAAGKASSPSLHTRRAVSIVP